MPLPSVSVDDPHVAAHNDERAEINALRVLADAGPINFLQKALNLADLNSASAARANLGIVADANTIDIGGQTILDADTDTLMVGGNLLLQSDAQKIRIGDMLIQFGSNIVAPNGSGDFSIAYPTPFSSSSGYVLLTPGDVAGGLISTVRISSATTGVNGRAFNNSGPITSGNIRVNWVAIDVA